jgi:hypothetical protein
MVPEFAQFLVSFALKSDLLQYVTASALDHWRTSRFTGTYDVDHYSATLEILDSKGKRAIYTKREQIRFLRDQAFAIQDQAWGDGNIFADYRCSPGCIVDKYQEGYRWYVVISLRRNYKKGDQEELFIERTIEDGFTTANETFQIQIDHPTKELNATIIFPRTRLPKQVFIVENNFKQSQQLGPEHETHFPDGRVSYTWKVTKARLFEGYIFKWEW